jgi:hypothetical protein
MPLTPQDSAAIDLVTRISQASDGEELEIVFTAVVNFLAMLLGQMAHSPEEVEERLQATIGFVRESVLANEDPHRRSAMHNDTTTKLLEMAGHIPRRPRGSCSSFSRRHLMTSPRMRRASLQGSGVGILGMGCLVDPPAIQGRRG